MIEMLGRLAYGGVGDLLFTVRIDGTRVAHAIGDLMTLHMDTRHLHWFDAESKQRL